MAAQRASAGLSSGRRCRRHGPCSSARPGSRCPGSASPHRRPVGRQPCSTRRVDDDVDRGRHPKPTVCRRATLHRRANGAQTGERMELAAARADDGLASVVRECMKVPRGVERGRRESDKPRLTIARQTTKVRPSSIRSTDHASIQHLDVGHRDDHSFRDDVDFCAVAAGSSERAKHRDAWRTGVRPHPRDANAATVGAEHREPWNCGLRPHTWHPTAAAIRADNR